MRSVFDQYDLAENKLTHALAVTLSEDPVFARRFLKHCGIAAPSRRLEIVVSEQSAGGRPGEPGRAPSIPDIAITAGEGFCVLVESKVAARLELDQIRRHVVSAQRAGFASPRVVALTLKEQSGLKLASVEQMSWSGLYEMLGRESARPWPKRLLEYMDTLEAQMITQGYLKHEKLTTFRGIPFDHDNPYEYAEARRLLGLVMDELRADRKLTARLKIDNSNPGRSAITGRKAPGVWDFLALKAHRAYKNHTAFPHLTLSISDSRVAAVVTVPDKVDVRVRRTLLGDHYEDFEELLRSVTSRIEDLTRKHQAKGVKPYLELMQRHYRTQRSHPTLDGALSFDLRTAFPSKRRAKRGTRVATQPQWLEAAYNLLREKHSNIQWGVGVYVGYDECDIQKTRAILGFISGTWLALEPLLEVAHRSVRAGR